MQPGSARRNPSWGVWDPRVPQFKCHGYSRALPGGIHRGGMWDPSGCHSSKVDDDDAAVRALVVLVLFLLVVAGRALPPLVADRDLQLRPFAAPPLLFLAASDLFDDPGLEHRENLYLNPCNIPAR